VAAAFGGTKAEIPDEYKRRGAEYWPERLTMPVGITASGQDESVPPRSVPRLADTLEELGRPVKLIYREQRGHDSNYADTRAAIEFAANRLPIPGTFTWGSAFAAGSTSDLEIYRNGGTELTSTVEEFAETIELAKDGKIVVLVFHGVPDYYAHCSTDLDTFKQCMKRLHDAGCSVSHFGIC